MKKSTAIKRVFSICLASAILASTGTAALTAKADERENTESTASETTATDTSEEDASEEGDLGELGLGNLDDPDFEKYADHSTDIEPKNAAAALPDAVDNTTNSNAKFFPEIDSQGALGSCCTWAETYYQFTYMSNKANNITTTKENTFSPTWTYNLYCLDDDDGSSSSGIYNIMQYMGCVTVQDVPIVTTKNPRSGFLDWHATDDIWAKATENRITGYKSMEVSGNVTDNKDTDLNEIKEALSNGDVLTFSTYFRSWHKNGRIKSSSQNGVDNSHVGEQAVSACIGFSGGHRMTLVGYNDNIWIDINNNNKVDNGEMGAFKVANSHGKGYGNNGFMWVAYDALNRKSFVSGVQNQSDRNKIFWDIASIKVKKNNYSSGMLLKCVLHSSCKYEVSVKATAVNKTTNESKSFVFYPYPNFETSLPSPVPNGNFAGEYEAADATFYYDLNNVVSGLTSSNINNYTWTFEFNDKYDNDSALTIKECKIVNRKTNAEIDYLGEYTITLNGNTNTISKSNLNSQLVAPLEITPVGNFGTKDLYTDKARVSGAAGKNPYIVKWDITRYGNQYSTKTETFKNQKHTGVGTSKIIAQPGKYELKTTVTDAEGTTYTNTQSFSVYGTDVTELTTNSETKFGSVDYFHSGDTVVVTPTVKGLPSDTSSLTFRYIIKDNLNNSLVAQYDLGANQPLTWTPTEKRDYAVYYRILNGSTVLDSTVKLIGVLDEFTNPSFEIDVPDQANIGDLWYVRTDIVGNNDQYIQRVEIIKDGKVYDRITNNLSSSSKHFHATTSNTLFLEGTFTIRATVIDPLQVDSFITKSKTFTVKPTKITSLTANKSSCYQYDSVVIKPTTENLSNRYSINGKTTYTVTKNGVSSKYEAGENNTLNWTPTETGTYNIKCDYDYSDYYTSPTHLDSKTITYKVNKTQIKSLTANKSPIYANETVTITPKANVSSNVPLSSYKYTVTKDGVSKSIAANAKGQLSWKPTETGTYAVKCSIVHNSKTLATKTVNFNVEKKPLSASVKVTPDGDLGIPENVTIKATAAGGTAPYQYRYEMQRFGQTTVIKDWSTSASVKKLIEQDGYYTFTVYVKDADGNQISKQATKTVNRCLVNFTTDKTEGKTGEQVTITPTLSTPTSLIKAANYKYTITKGSTSTKYNANSGNALVWTPAEAGTYTIKCEVVYKGVTYDAYSKSFKVNDADNDITIYYKGYNKPYIHYRVAGGSWTDVPGVAMTSSFALGAYPYKYTIKLNGAASAEVCFNDGNNNWDSNNGANYTFTKGTYTFKDGVITAIENPGLAAKVSVSKTTIINNETVKLTAAGENGTAPYTYAFSYTYNGKTTQIRDFAASKTCNVVLTVPGTYLIYATVKDANGNTAISTSKVITVNHPQITAVHTSADKIYYGQNVNFTLDTANTYDGLTVRYSMQKDHWYESYETALGETFTWTPQGWGDYSIAVSLMNNGTEVATYTFGYTVENTPANTVTIYYNGYANPNIHYQVGNGAWTNVPGVAMTPTKDLPGYTHRYVIDLGSASYANVCFNDGNNNWDSNNGANYRFTKGTYKFSNGTITAM